MLVRRVEQAGRRADGGGGRQRRPRWSPPGVGVALKLKARDLGVL